MDLSDMAATPTNGEEVCAMQVFQPPHHTTQGNGIVYLDAETSTICQWHRQLPQAKAARQALWLAEDGRVVAVSQQLPAVEQLLGEPECPLHQH